MAIFKANSVKRGTDAPKRAKASIRYIQHRRGKDGEKISRTLFNSDGPMDRIDAYSIIDEAAKGAYFYRFILSPDPKKEDHNHDLDMRDIAERTMLALEERLGVPIQWLGAVHADHAPHLHAHLIAVVPKRLYVKDFMALRGKYSTNPPPPSEKQALSSKSCYKVVHGKHPTPGEVDLRTCPRARG
jgi:hypothetical protein